MDGCFTSGRLKSKGKDQLNNFDRHFILKNEEETNESIQVHPIEPSNCKSKFFAMKENMGESIKYNRLDETGHFGLACARHEVMIKMVDMTSGERFIYPDLLLKNYFESESNPENIYLYYDIMCKYSAHLERHKVLPAVLMKKMKFLIGQFHVLPHGSKCIENLQPYITKGNGQVDGEALERRWAFFRPHLYSLKHMTAENRAIFIERLCWWLYQQQTIQIVPRIIKMWKECKKQLTFLNMIELEDSDSNIDNNNVFQKIDTSKLSPSLQNMLGNIEDTSKQYALNDLFLKEKV